MDYVHVLLRRILIKFLLLECYLLRIRAFASTFLIDLSGGIIDHQSTVKFKVLGKHTNMLYESFIRLFIPPGLPLRLSHKMTLVNLNSIQFYQPLTEAQACLAKGYPKRPTLAAPRSSEGGKSPKAPESSDEWSDLWGNNPIRFINMTDSLMRSQSFPRTSSRFQRHRSRHRG